MLNPRYAPRQRGATEAPPDICVTSCKASDYASKFAHTKRSRIAEVNPAVQSPALNVSKCSGAEQHKSKKSKTHE